MILEQFDPSPAAVINPWEHCPKIDGFPKTVVACFAHNLIEYALSRFGGEVIASPSNANGAQPVYALQFDGVRLGLTMAAVGAPPSVGQFDEIFAMGAERIVVFGTCGVLDASVADRAILLPYRAVRDEGTSFHYAPPSDEIDVNVGVLDRLAAFFTQRGIGHTMCKTWTTDAFYRETRQKVTRRKADGCACVDMECSAFAALAHLRKKHVAQFFYAADNLDAALWDARSLSNEEGLDDKCAIVDLALAFAAQWEQESNMTDALLAGL